jgi:hypothetical protein
MIVGFQMVPTLSRDRESLSEGRVGGVMGIGVCQWPWRRPESVTPAAMVEVPRVVRQI